MAYDIIGDIHGQADKLEALLRTLGYRDTAGAWRHQERQAIFVGDFLDRGPASVRSIDIARRTHPIPRIQGSSCDRTSAPNGETRTGNSTPPSWPKWRTDRCCMPRSSTGF